MICWMGMCGLYEYDGGKVKRNQHKHHPCYDLDVLKSICLPGRSTGKSIEIAVTRESEILCMFHTMAGPSLHVINVYDDMHGHILQ